MKKWLDSLTIRYDQEEIIRPFSERIYYRFTTAMDRISEHAEEFLEQRLII
ncbi:MAG: hypothetical protein HY882_06860 [Deltaproteobacteria bacterium]|nr:hypothetical protein [Deltaproteobacteria bacterium]